MRVERKAIDAWRPASLVWTTQFNDLRLPDSYSPGGVRRLNTELKMLALFSPGALIRDADVINHVELLDMLIRNSGGIRKAFECGALVLGIRDSAASFAEVNARAGKSRAFPERHEQVKDKLETVDAWLADEGLVLAETTTTSEDMFSKLLDVVVRSGSISATQQDALSTAIEAARRSCGDSSALRFGHLYRELSSANSDLVQWCRAAHILAGSETHRLPPSTANSDLAPDMVAVLLNCAPTPAAASVWADMYPKRILTSQTLQRLDFAKIASLRVKGAGYFRAAEAVQLAYGTPGFHDAYGAYLDALGAYLEAIGAEVSVEMVEWQKALLDRRVDIARDNEKTVLWAVPVVLSAAATIADALTHGALETICVVPALIASVASATIGVERWRSHRHAKSPPLLTQLQRGTTVTPRSR